MSVVDSECGVQVGVHSERGAGGHLWRQVDPTKWTALSGPLSEVDSERLAGGVCLSGI